MNEKVLIVGGNGFLGRRISRRLLESKFSSVGVADITRGSGGTAQHVCDLLDTGSLDQVIREYDVIINCTGQITNPVDDCLALNTKGVANLSECVRKYERKIIQISSVSVYGSRDSVDEDSAVRPETVYGALKYFAEFTVTSLIPAGNRLILRLSNLYGEGQGKGIIDYLLRSSTSGEELHFNNDGSLVRYYVHVDDCADLIAEILENGYFDGTYNVVGKDRCSVLELEELFRRVLKRDFRVRYDNTRAWENIGEISDQRIREKVHFEYRHGICDFIRSRMETDGRE